MKLPVFIKNISCLIIVILISKISIAQSFRFKLRPKRGGGAKRAVLRTTKHRVHTVANHLRIRNNLRLLIDYFSMEEFSHILVYIEKVLADGQEYSSVVQDEINRFVEIELTMVQEIFGLTTRQVTNCTNSDPDNLILEMSNRIADNLFRLFQLLESESLPDNYLHDLIDQESRQADHFNQCQQRKASLQETLR